MSLVNIKGIEVPYNFDSRHFMANHDGKGRLAIFPFFPDNIRQYESDLKNFHIRIGSYIRMIEDVLKSRKAFFYNRVEEVDLSDKQIEDLYRGLRFFGRLKHRLEHFRGN